MADFWSEEYLGGQYKIRIWDTTLSGEFNIFFEKVGGKCKIWIWDATKILLENIIEKFLWPYGRFWSLVLEDWKYEV